MSKCTFVLACTTDSSKFISRSICRPQELQIGLILSKDEKCLDTLSAEEKLNTGFSYETGEMREASKLSYAKEDETSFYFW